MELAHLYISPGHNYFGHHGKPAGRAPVTEVDQIECVAGKGIVGDRFFGYKDDYKGQATFFSFEVYEALCQKFGTNDKSPAAFRRNIVVRGADLNALIGQEFEFGSVHFLGTEEAKPCYWMEQAFCEGAEKALEGNGGLRVKILSDGTIRKTPVPT